MLASQGKSFPDTLAASVNFTFDEHISIRFFISYILGIHSMPSKKEEYRLRRVLDAIEEASFQYMKKYGMFCVCVGGGSFTTQMLFRYFCSSKVLIIIHSSISRNRKKGKLTMPREHIDFHIISY